MSAQMTRTKRESWCSSRAGVECGAKMDPGSEACAREACASKERNANTATADDDRWNHRLDLGRMRILAFNPRYRKNRYDAGPIRAVVLLADLEVAPGEAQRVGCALWNQGANHPDGFILTHVSRVIRLHAAHGAVMQDCRARQKNMSRSDAMHAAPACGVRRAAVAEIPGRARTQHIGTRR